MDYFVLFILTATVVNVATSFPHAKLKSIDESLMQVDPHTWAQENARTHEEVRAQVPSGCDNKPADVYFVLDTSADVTDSKLDRQKVYATELLRLFYLGQDTTRVGAMSSGDDVQMSLNLDTYQKLHEIQESIKKIPFVGGKRNMANTLKYIRLKAFSEAKSRQNVAHVVIMFVSGAPEFTNAIDNEAKLLQKSGIYLYVVGVGKNVPRKHLKRIASRPSRSFVYGDEDFGIADSMIQLLGVHLCDVQISPPKPQPRIPTCSAKRPVDVIFSVDDTSIGAVNSRKIINLLEALTSVFDSSNDNIKIALLKSKNINFGKVEKTFKTVKDFRGRLGKVTIPNHSEILKRARRFAKRGRKDAQKIMVHFVDENVDITKETLIQAKKNRFSKMDTYIVGVGKQLDKSSINAMASKPKEQYVIDVQSYHQLLNEWQTVLHRICKGM